MLLISKVFEAIVAFKEASSKQGTRIIETSFLVHRCNLLHVFGIQFEVCFQVGNDLPVDDALCKNRASVVDTPCVGYLVRRFAVFLSDLD